MIPSDFYFKINNIERATDIKGGQELILFEIIASCYGFESVYLPFGSSQTLTNYLLSLNFKVISHDIKKPDDFLNFPRADVLYFGTPTIVGNSLLFIDGFEGFEDLWNKKAERNFVQWICSEAINRGYKRILSGLGSGDITVDERISDMGGGKVICYKRFVDFKDWVIGRNLYE